MMLPGFTGSLPISISAVLGRRLLSARPTDYSLSRYSIVYVTMSAIFLCPFRRVAARALPMFPSSALIRRCVL